MWCSSAKAESSGFVYHNIPILLQHHKKMPKKSIKHVSELEDEEFDRRLPPKLTELRLHDILSMDKVFTLKFLAHHGLLRDGGICRKCPNSPQLTLVLSPKRRKIRITV